MKYDSTAYRYPGENVILVSTILVALLIIGFTAAATLCGSVLFIVLILVLSYNASTSHHRQLLRVARRISNQDDTQLAAAIRVCAQRLQVEPVQIFVIPGDTLNAYTFGLDSPKAIVLYNPLFDVMDIQEMQFIIGHEMGHVKLGHTWLNSLVGGMSGIPANASASLILVLALRWWNRACEFSADRAGVLACGSPEKAITALIKIEAGPGVTAGGLTQEEYRQAMQNIENEDDSWMNNLSEILGTHPMIVKRIQQIRAFSQTPDYNSLQAKLNQNVKT